MKTLFTLTLAHTLTPGSCPVQTQSDLMGVKGLAEGHLSGGNEGGASAALSLHTPRLILPLHGSNCDLLVIYIRFFNVFFL